MRTMRKRFLVLGTLLCLSLIAMVVGVYIAYGAIVISLTDNTLVTDDNMLRCLAGGGKKALITTGGAGNTFAIYEDGVLVKTITLATASEKYTFEHISTTYKVDWNGNDTATLYCQ